eukprot:351609-Chlamydomonas_euryale.AAC.4
MTFADAPLAMHSAMASAAAAAATPRRMTFLLCNNPGTRGKDLDKAPNVNYLARATSLLCNTYAPRVGHTHATQACPVVRTFRTCMLGRGRVVGAEPQAENRVERSRRSSTCALHDLTQIPIHRINTARKVAALGSFAGALETCRV